ncbi:MAG: hypothetical protein JXR37_25015 [Kiritimatiellae bacterium]|nr:hypothetical protein [Kiritimatiellia bacterium]
MEIYRRLLQREAEGKGIKVGLVGCGQMGSGMVHAVHNVEGMAMMAIADLVPDRAVAALAEIGVREQDVVVTDNRGKAEDALRVGRRVVTTDACLVPALDGVDAVVEATGYADNGAQVAWSAIMNRTPVVMLNVETDVTVGVFLDRLARRMGSVYTVAMGDEPGVLMLLYNQARVMGFEVVCLAKGKNNPVDFTMTPDRCAEEAARKEMNPKMLCAFIDGTKTMVEMAAVSNATGLLPDKPGMHGPKVELSELVSRFIPKADGGLFDRRGTVDFSTGKIAPGVFAIVASDDAHIRKDMKFFGHGEGPYYLQYRPYHNCNLEVPMSIAEAVLYGERTITPLATHSEVVCMAKRDLKRGEKVGGIGGPDIFGRIYTYTEAAAMNAVPIGLAEGGTVTADIPAGAPVTEQAFAPDAGTFVYRLRKMQDTLGEGKGWE